MLYYTFLVSGRNFKLMETRWTGHWLEGNIFPKYSCRCTNGHSEIGRSSTKVRFILQNL